MDKRDIGTDKQFISQIYTHQIAATINEKSKPILEKKGISFSSQTTALKLAIEFVSDWLIQHKMDLSIDTSLRESRGAIGKSRHQDGYVERNLCLELGMPIIQQLKELRNCRSRDIDSEISQIPQKALGSGLVQSSDNSEFSEQSDFEDACKLREEFLEENKKKHRHHRKEVQKVERKKNRIEEMADDVVDKIREDFLLKEEDTFTESSDGDKDVNVWDSNYALNKDKRVALSDKKQRQLDRESRRHAKESGRRSRRESSKVDSSYSNSKSDRRRHHHHRNEPSYVSYTGTDYTYGTYTGYSGYSGYTNGYSSYAPNGSYNYSYTTSKPERTPSYSARSPQQPSNGSYQDYSSQKQQTPSVQRDQQPEASYDSYTTGNTHIDSVTDTPKQNYSEYSKGNGQSYYSKGNGQSYYSKGNGQSYYSKGDGQSYYSKGDDQSYYSKGNGQSYYSKGNGQSYYSKGNGQSYYSYSKGYDQYSAYSMSAKKRSEAEWKELERNQGSTVFVGPVEFEEREKVSQGGSYFKDADAVYEPPPSRSDFDPPVYQSPDNGSSQKVQDGGVIVHQENIVTEQNIYQ